MERSTSPAGSARAAGCWTISDGRAGNVRQASALARALGLHAREWMLQARAPWRWAAPRLLPGSRHAFGPAFADALAQPPALAIGCGRQGALATRLARARGARAVQVLAPRLPPALWDLVIAPRHDGLRGDNVLTLLGSLNPVDDAWLRLAREAFAALGRLPRPRIAVLLGGPANHVRYDPAVVERWLDTVDATVGADGGSVLLTASRRTPGALRQAIRARYPRGDHLVWLDDTDGANPYAGILAWADRVVCSPDSVNMVSEACGTYVPAFVAGIDRVEGRIRGFLDELVAMGRVRPLEAGLAPFPVEPLRETERIAAQLKDRGDIAP
jgi:mitochondrial fission protein ELM1